MTNSTEAFETALAHHRAGRMAEAAAAYRVAIRLQPDDADSHNNLGTVLKEQGRLDEAIACYRQALALLPDAAEPYYNLGVVLSAQNRTAEAIDAYGEALRRQPNYVRALVNYGSLVERQGRLDEALACYDRVLQLQPDSAMGHLCRGSALSAMGEFSTALAEFDQAMRLDASLPLLRTNRAIMLLLHGNFAEGWPEYEWRWQDANAPQARWTQPLWDGSPLAGRTILLHLEQGRGDALQFIRYAPLLEHQGATVLVAAPRRMIPILSTCPGIDRFYCGDEPVGPFDVHAPLLSLPGCFHTDLTNIPANVPYLSARDDLVERWRDRLRDDGRLRVGINWQGTPASATYRGNPAKAIPLEAFAPLAEIAGVRLLSLQKGAGTEQLAGARFAVEDLGSQLDETCGAFEETAAVIKHLDLVISSDTALVHLAGALAAPVWVLLPRSSDWRWLLDRSDSPWYPTMRLFRQARLGDWSDVFRRIAAELATLAAAKRGQT